VTAGELAKRFAANQKTALRGEAGTPLGDAAHFLAQLAGQDLANRPFAHPYYWAAFTFSGA